MRFLKYAGIVVAFGVLTLISQIGGLVLLASLPLFQLIDKKVTGLRIVRTVFKTAIFCLLYTVTTFWLVPPIAKYFGRVPMPYSDEHPNLRQHNFMTVLLNRHYVKPTLRKITEGVAEKLAERYQDSLVLTYLDCNFPFFEGFPLQPHLSHDDGRKIDLSFQYMDAKTQKVTYDCPSWLGYGVCEEPRVGEENYPEKCKEDGNWQYSFMRNTIVSQGAKNNFIFDAVKTKDVMSYFLADNRVNFILIEPHLKKRLGFENNQKVRRPPCFAVRHDDHLHVAIY
jgi:hypothetical protein